MRKYHIGEDENKSDNFLEAQPKTVEELKERVSQMCILANVESRGSKTFVRVMEHAGTNQFMASGYEDHFWLNRFCKKKEVIGAATYYHFSF